MSTTYAPPLPLSGRPLAVAIDRWIWVFMAMLFIAVVLLGFIPDSLMKVGMVRAGARPPFPPILHVHAVLMGGFLLLLLAQSWLVATGRRDRHMWLGRIAFLLAPALVVVGVLLAPTIYQQVWHGAQSAPDPIRAQLRDRLLRLENIALVQFRVGLVFSTCIALALRARRIDNDFHKRMIFLAIASALPAAIDRMDWLPNTMPANPISTDLYLLLVIAPMLLWDAFRHRAALKAYVAWLGVYVACCIPVYVLWNTPAWHAIARRMLEP